MTHTFIPSRRVLWPAAKFFCMADICAMILAFLFTRGGGFMGESKD
jgi:hypothetical protein